jgi:hypothetical protein
MKTLTFKISNEAFDLLKKIGKGSAEYRDPEFESIEDFRKSNSYEFRNDEWFLNRNFGGTYYLISELYKYGLVDSDGESWHMTYILTPFGREILESQ